MLAIYLSRYEAHLATMQSHMLHVYLYVRWLWRMRGVVYACVYSVSIRGVVNARMHVSVFCRVRGMLGVMSYGVQCTHCAAYTWCPACMARCMRGRANVLCSVRVVRCMPGAVYCMCCPVCVCRRVRCMYLFATGVCVVWDFMHGVVHSGCVVRAWRG